MIFVINRSVVAQKIEKQARRFFYPPLIFFFICVFFAYFGTSSCRQATHRINTKLSMEKKYVIAEGAPAALGPYSHAVLAGNLLFVSGQIGLEPATNEVPTDFEAETHQVMKNIGTILRSQGLDYKDVVKTTIFLKDMGQFPVVNTIYGSYFQADAYPARETVEVSQLPKNVRVEISVTAYKK